MRKLFQYILIIFALGTLVSCSQEILFESTEQAQTGFVVGSFPSFGGANARAIGIEDEGKTQWEKNDEIFVTLTSSRYGRQIAVLTYDGDVWSTNVSFSYLEHEKPSVTAIYAPCYEVKDNVLHLKDGMQLGMNEYLEADCEIKNGIINISFAHVYRTYSRLRIVGLEGTVCTVAVTGFFPAEKIGDRWPWELTAEDCESHTYTLTTDEKGNAYLYGVFTEEATVRVTKGDLTLEDYTFGFHTEYNMSYALDARPGPVIDGTLGGKAEATDEDINALVEQLKAYVDNGITTIIVPGSEPALIEMVEWTNTAIGEAIYRLSGGDAGYDENNPYNGKIDLILSDVTEIMEWEFYDAFALNSITLPKVTTVGNEAFQGCDYLKQITFGSVVTSISGRDAFRRVGEKVDGGLCDLVLNIGQTATGYQPNLETRTWLDTEWKSITLQ